MLGGNSFTSLFLILDIFISIKMNLERSQSKTWEESDGGGEVDPGHVDGDGTQSKGGPCNSLDPVVWKQPLEEGEKDTKASCSAECVV